MSCPMCPMVDNHLEDRKKSKALMTDLVMSKRVRCELDGSKTHDKFVDIGHLDVQGIGARVIADRVRTTAKLEAARCLRN
jgi:hypothetical protein